MASGEDVAVPDGRQVAPSPGDGLHEPALSTSRHALLHKPPHTCKNPKQPKQSFGCALNDTKQNLNCGRDCAELDLFIVCTRVLCFESFNEDGSLVLVDSELLSQRLGSDSVDHPVTDLQHRGDNTYMCEVKIPGSGAGRTG